VAVDGVKLSAVCDVVPDAVAATASTYGVVAQYTDYKEMICKERPDILAIATRTPERIEIIRFAAENGVKGIHIEKPLAQSLGGCLDALEAMDKHGVKATYGVYRRYHPAYLAARDLVRSGHIGDLREMTVEFCRSLLLWYHPHSIDLLIMFANGAKPESVWADCAFESENLIGNVLDEDPVVLHGYVRFAGGLTGTITQAGGMNFRLGGALGAIGVLRNGESVVSRICSSETDKNFSHRDESMIICEMSATMAAFSELRDCVSSGKDTSLSLSDLEMGTRLLLSLAYSACIGGKTVCPQNLPSDFKVTGRFNDLYA
jgi:hypothetical protein